MAIFISDPKGAESINYSKMKTKLFLTRWLLEMVIPEQGLNPRWLMFSAAGDSNIH